MASESKPFSVWLRDERNARGWTLEGLAERLNSSAPVISNLEREIRKPSKKMVDRLARALAPDGMDEEESQFAHRRLLNAGMMAAGFLPDEEPEYSDEPDDYIDTITREIGYSDVMLSPEAKRKARESLETTIMGLVEQQKREQQISETAKFKARPSQAQKKKGEG